MIFYFSGTGNSLDVAQQIAHLCGDSIISIPDEMKSNKDIYKYKLDDDEAIGFIYPVYAWAPPLMVTDFISKLSIPKAENRYFYSIATCGENIGNTMDVLNRTLVRNNFHLDSAFSVIMPNNYIVMWDVDSHEEISRRLENSKERIQSISKAIQNKESGVFQVTKGPVPFIFTSIINPLFNKFARETKNFYADDTCTDCGLCEEVCPTKNIVANSKPIWGNNCTHCLACIHRCPEKAIQYGEKTKSRGRYVNPCLEK
ncbi:MAG TPA: EFR1 family ferrodoxin [Anaerovoracaceae bacterium]|nr:EFR1 family ferrodoxin [Anaerovoracaceae bacterium]